MILFVSIIMLSVQIKKKVKKKYFGLSGVCGIRTLNLDIPEMQLDLEKDHLTTELSGPINVKD